MRRAIGSRAWEFLYRKSSTYVGGTILQVDMGCARRLRRLLSSSRYVTVELQSCTDFPLATPTITQCVSMKRVSRANKETAVCKCPVSGGDADTGLILPGDRRRDCRPRSIQCFVAAGGTRSALRAEARQPPTVPHPTAN